jgi:hypothetical protein
MTKGYQYQTEQEAQTAQSACNAYYGIPVNDEDVTRNWVGYSFAELNTPTFWYIVYDESLLPVLGSPIEFEVIQPDINGQS